MTTVAPVDRRTAIRDLLRERTVHSQSELMALLEERGLACSQPALSRDLRALGVGDRPRFDKMVSEGKEQMPSFRVC